MTKIAGAYGEYGTHMTTEYDAYPLIPEEVSKEIVGGVTETSAALKTFTRLPDMSSKTYRMPVLSTLGTADFTADTVDDSLTVGVDYQIDDAAMLELKGYPYGSGDPGHIPAEGAPGLKKTLQMMWENVYIVAETIAVMIPIPDSVIDDSSYNLWEEVKPRIVEAFGGKIDSAMIFGQGRPVTWPSGAVPTAINRGQTVAEGTAKDLAIDISNLMAILEDGGFDPDNFLAPVNLKAKLRNLRDGDGNLIFVPGLQKAPDTIYGVPISYVKNGTFNKSLFSLVAADTRNVKYSIRQDISYKIFEEGVITDADGKVILNLMQQDSKAMRVVMRLGWAVPNPVHALNANQAVYPFAVMTA